MQERAIGVAGLGTMGLGIAQVYAAAGFRVLATDALAQVRVTAHERLAKALEPRVAAGKLSPEARDATLANMVIVDTPEDLAPADLVIEAIVEEMSAKRDLLMRIDSAMARWAVLATNTSSLSVTELATNLAQPSRLVALHFFNPAPAMKLVELAAHRGTDPAAQALARRVTEAAGKTVISCPDRPGFIVNRCARPYYGEALALLEEGRNAAEIDAAMLAAGYKLGPFALIDLIGADVNLAATESLGRAMNGNPRYHTFAALRRQVASGQLGRKSCRGFIFPADPASAPADSEAIALRIEATLINEAGWLLAEGGVEPQGVDTAMRLGLNFPRGPFEALKHHGRFAVLKTLRELENTVPSHIAGRYRPAPFLEEE